MRLFFGIAPNDAARNAAAACAQACRAAIPGRYSRADNYHVTLLFIGGVDASRVGDVCDALCETVKNFPAPTLTLGAADIFGAPQSAVLIRRVESTLDLCALHDALQEALERRGLPCAQGPFAPHMTLARHADVRSADLSSLSAPAATFSAAQALLFESARDAEGVLRYTPLFGAAFGELVGADA